VPLTIRTQGGAGWSPGRSTTQPARGVLVHVPGLKSLFLDAGRRARLPLDVALRHNPVIFSNTACVSVRAEVPEEIGRFALGKRARSAKANSSDGDRDRAARASRRAVRGRRSRRRKKVSQVENQRPRHAQPLDEERARRGRSKDEHAPSSRTRRERAWLFGAEVTSLAAVQGFRLSRRSDRTRRSEVRAARVSPVMEQFIIPHAEDVLAAIKCTHGSGSKPWPLGQAPPPGSKAWTPNDHEVASSRRPAEHRGKGEPSCFFEIDTDKVTQEVESD